MMLLDFLFIPLLIYVTSSIVDGAPQYKTFSHAIKNGKMKGGNVENILFEYDSGPGVITEQWFTGELIC